MRQPSLRSQLNQIRLWVRQGRTDAWIAHKLDVSVEQLEQFKREHGLDGGAPVERVSEPPRAGVPLPPASEVVAPASEAPPVVPSPDTRAEPRAVPEPEGAPQADEERAPSRRRRRGRRGGRGRGRRTTSYEATFDHGQEGYGLWLDPAVTDDPVYAEHWAGHREVTVTLGREEITIRRPRAADRPPPRSQGRR